MWALGVKIFLFLLLDESITVSTFAINSVSQSFILLSKSSLSSLPTSFSKGSIQSVHVFSLTLFFLLGLFIILEIIKKNY